MKYRNTSLILAALISAVACAPLTSVTGQKPAGDTLPIEVFMAGQQCRPTTQSWTATWISTPDQLQEFVSRCHTNRIGFTQATMPDFDFQRFGLLAVEMGRKPTSGFGFVARKTTAAIKNSTVTLKLECFEPEPGTMTAQVETSPWILIRLPNGEYSEIRVLDQEDQLLARWNSPAD